MPQTSFTLTTRGPSLVEFTGEVVYDLLVGQLEARTTVPLPHPAVRRR